MELRQKFRNIVRAIVGMPEDPGQPPQYDRMAWYRAKVTTCASNGATCDVEPEDARISPENSVTVLVGVPGLVGVVQPGAIVMLGWERGDPARPRVVPIWESATVSKLILNAQLVILGAESGADFVALAQKVLTELNKISVAMNTHKHITAGLTSSVGDVAYTSASVAAAQAKAV